MVYVDLPLTYDKIGSHRVPITFINPKNNKSVLVNPMVDTGAGLSIIDDKYARLLGLDIKTGIQSDVVNGQADTSFYNHKLLVKAGPLKPVLADVSVATLKKGNFDINLLGITTMLQFHSVVFANEFVRFYDVPVTDTNDIPAPAEVVADKKKKKKANYAYAYYSLQSWKRRI